MRSMSFALAAVAFVVTGAAYAAGERASKEEAVTMVKKAVAHYKTAGRDKAFADFNTKGGSFTDRDLYIFASDLTGRTVAHGANEKLIGRDMLGLKDTEGKAFVAEFIERAKSGKGAWTDYKWPNPVSKEIEAKTTYCEPVDSLIVCGGVYK